jgi:hypothetical protein
MAAVKLALSGDAEADALLSTDAFALLIGMVLDQQFLGSGPAHPARVSALNASDL